MVQQPHVGASQPTTHHHPTFRPSPRYHHSNKSKSKSCSTSEAILVGLVLLIIQFLLLNFLAFVIHNEPFSAILSSSSSSSSPLPQQQQLLQKYSEPNVKRKPRPPDGTFNGYPVHLQTHGNISKPFSLIHCVGENYQTNSSWMHRSCRFSFLCFDRHEKEFVVFRQRDMEQKMAHFRTKFQRLTDVSQSFFLYGQENDTAIPRIEAAEKPILQQDPTAYSNHKYENSPSVSLGGINLKWGSEGVQRLEWFPKIRHTPPNSFYTLPSNVVLVPYHSLAGSNPGHLVWDDLMPLYTLLDMFQFVSPHKRHALDSATTEHDDDGFHPLLLRYILQDGPGLWASCDANPAKQKACQSMLDKFGPLLSTKTTNNTAITTQLDIQFHLNNMQHQISSPKPSLICARHGVAGIGALTDHGTDKLHGWHDRDYKQTQNHGRAGLFHKFRNHMMKNIGIAENHHDLSNPNAHQSYKIVFSLQTSNSRARNLDFIRQYQALKRYFADTTMDGPLDSNNKPSFPNVSVEQHVFSKMSLKQQATLASQTSIFITGCGGGAVTASFLSKGSTAILYYHEAGGRKENKPTYLPARLDWDYFNNIGYLNVHWMPSTTMNDPVDISALVDLVTNELRRIQRLDDADELR